MSNLNTLTTPSTGNIIAIIEKIERRHKIVVQTDDQTRIKFVVEESTSTILDLNNTPVTIDNLQPGVKVTVTPSSTNVSIAETIQFIA
jgi:hypothetical protein